MKYKLSHKKDGKWLPYGSFAPNKWGKMQASFKVTPELIELVNSNVGGWINFAAFEDEQSQHNKSKADGFQPQADDNEIPF